MKYFIPVFAIFFILLISCGEVNRGRNFLDPRPGPSQPRILQELEVCFSSDCRLTTEEVFAGDSYIVNIPGKICSEIYIEVIIPGHEPFPIFENGNWLPSVSDCRTAKIVTFNGLPSEFKIQAIYSTGSGYSEISRKILLRKK